MVHGQRGLRDGFAVTDRRSAQPTAPPSSPPFSSTFGRCFASSAAHQNGFAVLRTLLRRAVRRRRTRGRKRSRPVFSMQFASDLKNFNRADQHLDENRIVNDCLSALASLICGIEFVTESRSTSQSTLRAHRVVRRLWAFEYQHFGRNGSTKPCTNDRMLCSVSQLATPGEKPPALKSRGSP